MSMTKQERKETYAAIQNEMLLGNNKKAFEMLSAMCGKDTGLFLFADYDRVIEMRQSVIIEQ